MRSTAAIIQWNSKINYQNQIHKITDSYPQIWDPSFILDAVGVPDPSFKAFNIIWYKFPDFPTEKSYSFCTAGHGINWCDMKKRSLSKFIRGLIPGTKNFIYNLKGFHR